MSFTACKPLGLVLAIDCAGRSARASESTWPQPLSRCGHRGKLSRYNRRRQSANEKIDLNHSMLERTSSAKREKGDSREFRCCRNRMPHKSRMAIPHVAMAEPTTKAGTMLTLNVIQPKAVSPCCDSHSEAENARFCALKPRDSAAPGGSTIGTAALATLVTVWFVIPRFRGASPSVSASPSARVIFTIPDPTLTKKFQIQFPIRFRFSTPSQAAKVSFCETFGFSSSQPAGGIMTSY